MHYSDVIGQEAVKAQLRRQVAEDRVPHAQLFAGPEGVGKLPMALAFATALLCEHCTDGEPCGTCPSCKMADRLIHPDLHFVFPVVKPKGTSGEVTSDRYLDEWRKQIAETPYFDRTAWIARMGAENQQAIIGVAEASAIMRKLSTKPAIGRRKVMIIWQPELMNEPAANKLLKLLEEPPVDTCFLLVSDEPARLLTTIISRTQRVSFPPLTEADIAATLTGRHGLGTEDAAAIAHNVAGNYVAARRQLHVDEDKALFFDMFVLLMRLSYQRKVKDLYEWSERVSQWGRERQKDFLDYAGHMLRENFIYNFHQPALNYMTRKEADFAVRFARFINERNVIGIYTEIESARRDIVQNVNPRMVFFDFTLKMIVLLIR